MTDQPTPATPEDMQLLGEALQAAAHAAMHHSVDPDRRSAEKNRWALVTSKLATAAAAWKRIHAALTAPSQAAPAGMVLVPREPTKAMRSAAFDALEVDASKTKYATGIDARDAVWEAMLNAAPAAKAIDCGGCAPPVIVAPDDAPAAQVAECICDGATYRPDQAHPFLINQSCPRHGEQKAAAPAVVVDEAMVERACAVYDEDTGFGEGCYRDSMRKALTAALGREGGGNG